MNRRILVAGGAGFIGSNFLLYMVPRYPQITFIHMDKLTSPSNLGNLVDIEGHNNYRFIQGDITNRHAVNSIIRGQNVKDIINFAAETRAYKRISEVELFMYSNVIGSFNLLDAACRNGVERFIQISTAEVYGDLGTHGFFTENSPLAPNNPYSASKASADCMARAYYNTYGLRVCITRSVNNYGPFQHREKFIPMVIYHALNDRQVPIFGDGFCSRDWIYVLDHCRALELVLFYGSAGAIYNIGVEEERTNLELAGSILHIMGKSSSLLHFVPDRPGHDRRHALKSTRIKEELGWEPAHTIEVSLKETVNWYINKFTRDEQLRK